MSIISNTTVISNFASIGQLDVLRRLYQILHIPTEVYEEIAPGWKKATCSTGMSWLSSILLAKRDGCISLSWRRMNCGGSVSCPAPAQR